MFQWKITLTQFAKKFYYHVRYSRLVLLILSDMNSPRIPISCKILEFEFLYPIRYRNAHKFPV